MDEVERKMIKARTALVLKQPFFATLALRLPLQADPDCETAWTDGTVLAYNPAYIRELPLDELTGLCAHLVMHPACGHHLRRNGRDHHLWNSACDYAINWILLDAGITLPSGYLNHARYRHKNADEIYAMLSKTTVRNSPPTSSRDAGVGLGLATTDGALQPGDNHNDDAQASDDDSGSEQPPADTDIEATGDPGKSGEVRDSDIGDDAGDSTDPATPPDWDVALVQAANYARSIGRLPAGIGRLISDILEPKLDWRDILWRFIDDAARNDYAWIPPNRRYLHQGLFLPSSYNMELRELVIVVDTSGSISQEKFDFLAVELSEILELKAVRIHLLYCDAKVVDWYSVTREELPLTIKARGGGGTDFRPAFDWVEQQAINPACLIYLTDMVCDQFPPEEPPYPVLWARIGTGGEPPPFGELLDIQE